METVERMESNQPGRKPKHFTAESFSRLCDIMYETKLDEGAYLFWEGDAADKIYYLKEGNAKICKSTDEGKEFVLYLYRAGDLIGQLDTFEHSRQGYNCIMTEKGVVGIIQRKDLEVLLWQHGDLAIEFMKWMGLMHRVTQAKFRDLMLYGKPGALCSTLIRLSNTFGKVEPGRRIRIERKFTNTELAEIIGATRESVNRMLSELREQGVITMEKGYIIIENREYLKSLCNCENCPKDVCRV